MRIGVAGASGLIGSALVPALRAAGHEARTIGRGADADVRWDPARQMIDAAACADLEGFINLAGANIGQRWSAAHRRAIRDSRVQSTELLARTAASLRVLPQVFVSMSATGAYGDAGDRVLDESSPFGTDYLAEVARAWEGAAAPAASAGIRTVHPRLGVVLTRQGGAVEKLWPIFRLGLGGRVGNGRQWMSWVSLDDAVRGLLFLVEQPTLRGVVNLVAPQAVTNAEFTAALARAAHRPAPFPVPAAALKLMFGEMAEATLLASQRVQPQRLTAAGFRFAHATIDAALAAAGG